MVFNIIALARLALVAVCSTLHFIFPVHHLFTISQLPPTIGSTPAWQILPVAPPPPLFFNTCPRLTPLQFRYLPLASSQDESVLLVGAYGFIPISSDRLDCLSPPRRIKSTPIAIQVAPFTDTTKQTLVCLVKHWRPDFWTCAISVAFALLIGIVAALSFKLWKLSIQHAGSLKAQEEMATKNDVLTNTMQQIIEEAEGLIERRKRIIAQRDEAQRIALYFHRMSADLIEELAIIEPQEPFWARLLQNGLDVPQAVLDGVVPAATVVADAPVNPPPLLPGFEPCFGAVWE